jgi:hypothetical protein
VDGCITKAPAADRSPGRARWIVASRVQTLDGHRRGWHPAGRGPRGGQPPRPRAAWGDPGHPGRASTAIGRLPAEPWCTRCRPHAAWPVRLLPRAARTGPGHPPLAGGTHPCVRQPGRQPLLGALVLLRVPERAALGVQVGADPAGLALADAAVSIQHPDQATVRSVAFASPIGVVSLTIAPGRSKVVTHADAGGYPHHLTGHDWARRNRRLLAAEVSTVRRAATV